MRQGLPTVTPAAAATVCSDMSVTMRLQVSSTLAHAHTSVLMAVFQLNVG